MTQAIGELITDNGIQGTAANASYQEEQTYSYESLLFELGIDGRYGSTQMEADLSIQKARSVPAIHRFMFQRSVMAEWSSLLPKPRMTLRSCKRR